MRKALTLVGIMVFIAIISLISAVSISKFLRDKINNNESVAREILKTIATALDKYAADHNGVYANSEFQLFPKSMGGEAALPYLNKSYCTKTESGYTYSCDLEVTGYTLTARPQNCVTVGSKSFTMTTGGPITEDATCTAFGG